VDVQLSDGKQPFSADGSRNPVAHHSQKSTPPVTVWFAWILCPDDRQGLLHRHLTYGGSARLQQVAPARAQRPANAAVRAHLRRRRQAARRRQRRLQGWLVRPLERRQPPRQAGPSARIGRPVL
jgi:hypothetical protein